MEAGQVATELAIPVLKVEGETIPEVWEKAVILCWEQGIRLRTEYDREDDPESRDCSMVMVIRSPLGEPRIHRAFPGGLGDLEIYRQEVVVGIHDDVVDLIYLLVTVFECEQSLMIRVAPLLVEGVDPGIVHAVDDFLPVDFKFFQAGGEAAV